MTERTSSCAFILATVVALTACSESPTNPSEAPTSGTGAMTTAGPGSSTVGPTTTTTSPGATGGNTGGATGGNTGGNTGGATGGNTGGATGGNTGGATGGNTGGATGGNTGGDTGGPTGVTTSAPSSSSTSSDSSSAGPVGSSTGGEDTSAAPGGEPVFHIFMLMGQSNMAGVAPQQQSDKNTDERIKVLGGCNQPAGQWNVANPPLNDCPGESGINLSTSVDPGIWFAKTIVEKLPEGDTIGLVGTAESGESINTFISGGSHHQMILNKIALAKMAPNAHFAGVIFHQGESDSDPSVAPGWPAKVKQLYNEVKAAWGVDYEVPFILGELPAGGCCSGHNQWVHQAADELPLGAWVTQDGTMVMDQYHFDHASVVLMGTRYGEKMLEMLEW